MKTKAGLLALVLCSMPLAATTVQIDFSGTISVNDPNHHFNGLFHENETYTGRVTYASDAQTISSFVGATFQSASYEGPLSFDVNIGGYEFTSLPPAYAPPVFSEVHVQDQTPGEGNDGFLAIARTGLPDFMTFADLEYSQLDFQAYSSAGTLFNSNALPTSFSLDQLDVGGFGFIQFVGLDHSDQANISSNPLQSLTFTMLDDATPEPSTWLLLASGGALLAWRRKRA